MAAGAVMLAGTAISVYGQVKAANDKADAEQRAAELKRIESKEILDRAKINESVLGTEEIGAISNQIGGYAAGNVDVTTGSPLIAMEATHSYYQRELLNMQREAKFRSDQSLAGAASADTLSGEERSAGILNAAGSVITGASTAYKYYTPNSKA